MGNPNRMGAKTGPEIVSFVVQHVRRSGRADFANWCVGFAETTPSAQALSLWAKAYNESEARNVVRHLTTELGMNRVGPGQGTIVYTYPNSGPLD